MSRHCEHEVRGNPPNKWIATSLKLLAMTGTEEYEHF